MIIKFKIFIVLSFLCLVSMSFVAASDTDNIYFDITPPDGYFIDHCSDSTIYMRENETGDLICIFEVYGNTHLTGYENFVEPHISNTIKTSDYTAYETYDPDAGNSKTTILRTNKEGLEFQLVLDHHGSYDEDTFRHEVDILNQTAQSIKLK